MGVTTVPQFVPADAATRLAALEAAQPLRDYMSNAKALISGGGALNVDTGYNVKWSLRFLVMGAGRGPTTALAGHFVITMPPVGTVIPRVGGGAASVTVTTAGINFDPYDALYYILPLGSDQTSIPANFRIVQYTSDFVVPYNWLPICTRNSTETPETVKWATGVTMTPWWGPSYLNAWRDYDAGVRYGPGGYRKINNVVYMRGILAAGTVPAAAFILPVGFRPMVPVESLQIVSSASTFGEWRIYTDGTVYAQSGSNGYMSLASVSFPADA